MDNSTNLTASDEVRGSLDQGDGRTKTLKELKIAVQDLLDQTSRPLRYEDDSGPSSRPDYLKTDGPAEDPCITDRQKALLEYFDLFGVIGIWQYVKEIARYEQESDIQNQIGSSRLKRKRLQVPDDLGGHISWHKVISDCERGAQSRTLFYLSSLPPPLMASLIRGDLPSRMQDPEFRKAIGPFVTPRETQGTYATFVGKSSDLRSTQGSQDETGLGLSMDQLIKVTQTMRTYIDRKKTGSDTMAKSIDCVKSRSPSTAKLDYKAGQRRYGSGQFKDNFEAHKYWIETFEYCFLYWAQREADPEDALLKQYLLRCLVYVGLGSNVLERSRDHATHRGNESPLLGLFTATIKYLFKDEFNMEEFTYQIFRTVSIDDIGLDEIITAIFCSAYPWDCGLNADHCGGSTGTRVDRTNPGYLQGLADNARRIRESGVQELNIQESARKIDRIAKLLEFKKSKESPDTLSAPLQPIREELEHLKDALHAYEVKKTLAEGLASLGIEL